MDDPEYGSYTVSYADFVSASLGSLYSPDGWQSIIGITTDLLALTDPGTVPPARLAEARKALGQRAAQARQQRRLRLPVRQRSGDLPRGGLHRRLHPKNCGLAGADRAGTSGPRTSGGLGLVDRAMRAEHLDRPDEDAYTGPCNRKTAARC